MNRLEQIEQRLKEIELQLAPLELEQSDLRRERLTIISPFKVGDVITWTFGGAEPIQRKGVVIAILPHMGQCKWKVTTIRNDGSLGHSWDVWEWNEPQKVAGEVVPRRKD